MLHNPSIETTKEMKRMLFLLKSLSSLLSSLFLLAFFSLCCFLCAFSTPKQNTVPYEILPSVHRDLLQSLNTGLVFPTILPHALLQDGVYESLLRASVRAQLESANVERTNSCSFCRAANADDADAKSDRAVHRAQ